jgi:hypothetical protein
LKGKKLPKTGQLMHASKSLVTVEMKIVGGRNAGQEQRDRGGRQVTGGEATQETGLPVVAGAFHATHDMM